MRENKDKKKNKNKAKIGMAGLMLACTALLAACGKKNGEEAGAQQPMAAAVYGVSANMRNGGLAEGDEEVLYYVWDGALYRARPEEGGNGAADRERLDDNGAWALCLAEGTLYYASTDGRGKQGIYRIEEGSSEREPVLEQPAEAIYVTGGRLIFEGEEGICSVKPDGSGYQVLYEGGYDALSVEGNKLYFREKATGNYYRAALPADMQKGGEAQASQTQAPKTQAPKTQAPKTQAPQTGEAVEAMQMLIPLAQGDAPIVSEGYVYYGTGEWLKNYRIRADGTADRELRSGSNENFLVKGQRIFAGSQTAEWGEDSTAEWTVENEVRLLGLARGLLLFEAYTYEAGRQTDAVRIPQSIRLMAYDTESGGEPFVLEEDKAAAGIPDGAFAREMFGRLLQGNRNLLRNRAEGFLRDLEEGSAGIEVLYTDADGDGGEELFVRTQENNSYLFYAANSGIYCWNAEQSGEEGFFAPLKDGSFLRKSVYRGGGAVNEMYDRYLFQPGGQMTRTDTLQHMQLDLGSLELQAGESNIKSNTYYVSEKFVNEGEWEKALQEVLAMRLEIGDNET